MSGVDPRVKADLTKELDGYAARRGRFDCLTVPARRFLMVDGHGDPNTSTSYRDALSSIYPWAYACKFLSKRELDRDYGVPPLEALWWSEDLRAFTTARDKSRWHWTLMLLIPDWLGAEYVNAARATVAARGTAPALERVRLETFAEGPVVQTLHVGSYDDEAPVLERLHTEIVPGLGLTLTGKHHEIYLSDPRRTAPERLRTILRQPVAQSGQATKR